MSDDGDARRQIETIQKGLATDSMSRCEFLNRLAALGVGFGAAYVLGIKRADAAVSPDAAVNLTSNNPTLNDIIEEGRLQRESFDGKDAAGGNPDGTYRIADGPSNDEDDKDKDKDKDKDRDRDKEKDYSRSYSRDYSKYSREYSKYSREYSRYSRDYDRYSRENYSREYSRDFRRGGVG